ncbi:MAG: 23S rRNA pseudouridine(2605) synthase RluB [Gammaproteobacteria bacterium]
MNKTSSKETDSRMSGEKLQKVLARAGFGSRRELEDWIADGRVKVNGKQAKLGDRVSPGDKILVDGKKVATQEKEPTVHPVLLYNKPLGEICTRNDPEGRPTVYDHLPPLQHARWVSVGRLDINTTGLLLFTTDGELANRLMHPSAQIEREYAVRVMGEVTDDMLRAMLAGVMLDDGIASFKSIRDAGGDGANHWYHVVLMEGRNREVRRLWEAQGVKVSRLKRVRYGNIVIPSFVRAGKFVELPAAETKSLYQIAGLRWKAPQKPAEYRTRYEAKKRGDKRIPKPKDRRGLSAPQAGFHPDAAEARPAPWRAEGQRARPATSRSEGARARPATSRGEGARARPATSRGEEQRARPATSRSEGARARPATSRGEGPRARPATFRGEEQRARPATSRSEGQRGRPATSRADGQRAKPATPRAEGQRGKFGSTRSSQGSRSTTSSPRAGGKGAWPAAPKKRR